MTILTKKLLISELHYYKRIVCFLIFFLAATAIFGAQFCFIKSFDFNTIFQLCFVFLFVFLPFGYFLGLRKILKTRRLLKRIKSNRFKVVEKTVVDIIMQKYDDTDRYCQIVFGKKDGVWVSEKKCKEFNIGDVCYAFYFESNNDAFAVYSAKLYSLDADLLNRMK